MHLAMASHCGERPPLHGMGFGTGPRLIRIRVIYVCDNYAALVVLLCCEHIGRVSDFI